jgi:protein involved in polysaccharide export with SLBB domain
LSSLSSSFNALYAAGGISKIGTLRDIKVYRSGKVIASIDVYDYILNGNISGDVRLQDNDIIIVGPYDSLVKISGKVKRPMFYEMRHDESVKTLLDYAGGFTGDAYKKSVRLVRKTGAEYSIHTIDEFEMGTFKLNDGDSVSVDGILQRFSNKVEIKGAVMHPGSFQMDGRIATVRELINAAEGLREDAFTNRAVMHRTKDDLTLEVIPVDVLGILEGRVTDIPLKKEDVLFVPSKLDMLGEQTVSIVGEINAPGTYPYADNTTLEDLVLQAGGLTYAASTMKVDVYRRIINSKSREVSDCITETFSFALKDGFVIDGEVGFVLKPFDEVAVRRSPAFEKQRMVSISGEVNFDGYYSLKTRNYRVSDLVKDAGGLSKVAYVKGCRLERRMTEEERLQRETMLRASQIALYEENLTSDKAIDMGRGDSLLMMKLDMGNTYPVAIDLVAALENPGGEDDIILREGDRLLVPQYTSAVKISGDVMQPVSMTYVKGKSLSYYIKRAGGYGDNARKSKVYAIYMNGAVKEVESSKDIQPGCEIVVPSKKQKRQKSTAEMMSMGTSAASIATMVITVANILK